MDRLTAAPRDECNGRVATAARRGGAAGGAPQCTNYAAPAAGSTPHWSINWVCKARRLHAETSRNEDREITCGPAQGRGSRPTWNRAVQRRGRPGLCSKAQALASTHIDLRYTVTEEKTAQPRARCHDLQDHRTTLIEVTGTVALLILTAAGSSMSGPGSALYVLRHATPQRHGTARPRGTGRAMCSERRSVPCSSRC